MDADDNYFSIEKPAQGSFRDRGSRFIGLAFPVESQEEAKEILDRVRKEYYDATHHCYAWCLGADAQNYRISDDGEPSGTAGRPILGQIHSKKLSDVMLVVVRYYGGTKLGTSGLINAYRTAAGEALDAATPVEKILKSVYRIAFGYARMNDVMKILKDEGLEQKEHQFDLNCSLIFLVRRKDELRITEIFSRLEGVQLEKLK